MEIVPIDDVMVAEVRLSPREVGNQPGGNMILRGMVVDARINTGGKTLLEYPLKPVYRMLDNAFDEP